MRLRRLYSIVLLIVLLSASFGSTFRAMASADQTNLLANPSAETLSATGTPQNWTANSWGTNDAALATSTDAHTGTTALSVTTTTHTDGDAKWMPDAVTVAAGTQYTYTDFYKSSASTEIDAAYYDGSGNVSYYFLKSLAAASAWQQGSVTFTVPAGMQQVVLMHILPATGTLTTDDYSLSAVTAPPVVTPPANEGVIANPSMERSADGATPDSWLSSSWGTNTTSFAYSTDAHTGTHSAMTTISSYTDGDAKWYFKPVTTLDTTKTYDFSAWYRASTGVSAVAAYEMQDGTTQYATLTAPAAASTSTWKKYDTKLSLPTGVKSTTVYMLISSVGWLQTDDYSLNVYVPAAFKEGLVTLTFDDGWQNGYTNGLPLLKKYGLVSTQYIISGYIGAPQYMTKAQITAFKTQGSEIGSHTVSHPDLTKLTAAKLTTELKNSQTTLQSLFGTSQATNIASPYGAYNNAVITQMKKYYTSHRSTDTGFNSKDNFNAYNVVVQNVDADTTNAQVAQWVAKAKTDKTWLVLVYHQVENTLVKGDIYAVKTSNLDAQLKNIKASGVPVKTYKNALTEVKSQL